MVVVGAFPTDPIDPTDPRFVTTAGSIHAMAGILSFTCLAIAAPMLGRRVAAATGIRASRRLAAVTPLGYALFWLTGLLDHQLGGLFGERSAAGLGERVMAVAFIAWLLAVCFGIWRGGQAAAATDRT
ncbi:DUF998 domain-containing protein [Dactylosporangium sp. NPDC000244]|uniref:DUF998 domain-containing protein n=1 Tax=Dactylosporangium sp. NPDC000244 TaxID=3154365 RepID=UPI00331DDE0E